jgi:hypothetical protein
MDDAERVGFGDGVARLQDVVGDFIVRQRASSRENLREVGALEVLHDDVGDSAVERRHVEHAGDVLALELHRRARLAQESLDAVFAVHGLGAHQLDGDRLAEGDVGGGDDVAHPPLAEDTLDAVFARENVTHLHFAHQPRRIADFPRRSNSTLG